jgi:hypothetical protein
MVEAMLCLTLHLHGNTKGWPNTCSLRKTDQINTLTQSVCSNLIVISHAVGGEQWPCAPGLTQLPAC